MRFYLDYRASDTTWRLIKSIAAMPDEYNELSLRGCGLGKRSVYDLIKIFKAMPATIKMLDLRENDLDFSGALFKLICPYLPKALTMICIEEEVYDRSGVRLPVEKTFRIPIAIQPRLIFSEKPILLDDSEMSKVNLNEYCLALYEEIAQGIAQHKELSFFKPKLGPNNAAPQDGGPQPISTSRKGSFSGVDMDTNVGFSQVP